MEGVSWYSSHARHIKMRYRYVVDIPLIRTKRFTSTFNVRRYNHINSLPVSPLSEKYNLGVFKSRVNWFLLGNCDHNIA